MRISIRKKDNGYAKDAFNYKVKLNGEFIDNCFTADEEKGEAHCYQIDSENKLIPDDSGMNPTTEILYGKVEIIKPVNK